MSALRKVLLYSHDTYGLGHLRRNLAIARYLLRNQPGIQVVLVSGSTVADRFSLPSGLKVVQLPPVVKVGVDEYAARDGQLSLALVRRARSAVISDVVRRWRPDVFLVDHAPQGMKGELMPVFRALGKHSPSTRVVLGLRDILDEPARVRSTWEADGVYDTLDLVYDRIFVYGSPEVSDVVTEYGIEGPALQRLSYCGYVAAEAPPKCSLPPGLQEGEPFVLGTVGGGADGARVLEATLRAAAELSVRPVVVTGPLMAAPDRAELIALAGQVPGAVIVEHLPELPAVAMAARCIVTRGGYNSLCELAPLGVPTIVVPRSWPRREQVLRAEAFAQRGLVEVVEEHQEETDAFQSRLAAAIGRALQAPLYIGGESLDLGGLSRLTEGLVETCSSPKAAPGLGSEEDSKLVGAAL